MKDGTGTSDCDTKQKKKLILFLKITSRRKSVIHPKTTTLDVNDATSRVAAHQKQIGIQKLMQNFVLKSPYTGSQT
jgi:hypothetical protein